MALAGRVTMARPQGLRALPINVSRPRALCVRAAAGEADTKVVGKAVLVDLLAKKNGMTKEQASSAFETIFDNIVDAVAAGKRVTILQFGTFERRDRKERNGRNPSTGEPLTIPAAKTAVFKAAPAFKEAVNEVSAPKVDTPAPAAPKAVRPAPPPPARPAVKKVAPPKEK